MVRFVRSFYKRKHRDISERFYSYWKPNPKNEVPVAKKCFPTMPTGHTTFKLLQVVRSFVDSEKLPCFCEVQKVTKWIQIEMPWCRKWRQVVLELWALGDSCVSWLVDVHQSIWAIATFPVQTTRSEDSYGFLWALEGVLKEISERSSMCSHPSDSVLVVGFKNKSFWWDGARKGSKCHTSKSIVWTVGLCKAAYTNMHWCMKCCTEDFRDRPVDRKTDD